MYWNINAYILDKKGKTDVRHTIADNFSLNFIKYKSIILSLQIRVRIFRVRAHGIQHHLGGTGYNPTHLGIFLIKNTYIYIMLYSHYPLF